MRRRMRDGGERVGDRRAGGEGSRRKAFASCRRRLSAIVDAGRCDDSINRGESALICYNRSAAAALGACPASKREPAGAWKAQRPMWGG
jgi:hypothetical protein